MNKKNARLAWAAEYMSVGVTRNVWVVGWSPSAFTFGGEVVYAHIHDSISDESVEHWSHSISIWVVYYEGNTTQELNFEHILSDRLCVTVNDVFAPKTECQIICSSFSLFCEHLKQFKLRRIRDICFSLKCFFYWYIMVVIIYIYSNNLIWAHLFCAINAPSFFRKREGERERKKNAFILSVLSAYTAAIHKRLIKLNQRAFAQSHIWDWE